MADKYYIKCLKCSKPFQVKKSDLSKPDMDYCPSCNPKTKNQDNKEKNKGFKGATNSVKQFAQTIKETNKKMEEALKLDFDI
jgi:DNA-directed RNA polymerase subunit RPC12/RpoP